MREGGPQLLVGLQQPTSSRNIFCLSSTWEILSTWADLGTFGHFWARSRMGCLSIIVLVASLLAAQVRFVTGCSIKGDMQCIKMFLFLQNFNNNFLPLLESSVLMIISTKILICVGSFGGKVMTVYPSYLFNWT